MNYFIGVSLVVFGILVIIYGGKKITVKGGFILSLFTMPRLNALFVKWAVAILSIWFGLAFLIGAIKI
jgi:hypothetical protein